MKLPILFTFLFLWVVPLHAQKGFTVESDPTLVLEQKIEYTNPLFDKASMKKAINLGPALHNTYIDEPDANTLQDLVTLYQPFSDKWLPKKWPAEQYDVTKAKFVVLHFDSGEKMPAIQTPDGSVFSFLIEEDLLAFDIKHVFNHSTYGEMIGYMTFDTEKIK